MSMVKILLDLISIDGKIDSREIFVFEKIKSELGLMSEDHFKACQYNSILCLSVIKEMTDEQKQYYSKLMRDIIVADEEIEINEAIAYDNICKFCDIKKAAVL